MISIVRFYHLHLWLSTPEYYLKLNRTFILHTFHVEINPTTPSFSPILLRLSSENPIPFYSHIACDEYVCIVLAIEFISDPCPKPLFCTYIISSYSQVLLCWWYNTKRPPSAEHITGSWGCQATILRGYREGDNRQNHFNVRFHNLPISGCPPAHQIPSQHHHPTLAMNMITKKLLNKGVEIEKYIIHAFLVTIEIEFNKMFIWFCLNIISSLQRNVKHTQQPIYI